MLGVLGALDSTLIEKITGKYILIYIFILLNSLPKLKHFLLTIYEYRFFYTISSFYIGGIYLVLKGQSWDKLTKY